MNCSCGARLEVKHSYSIGQAKTQDAVCGSCGARHTLVTVVAEQNPVHGRGAYALAQKLRKGELGLVQLLGEG